MAHQLKHASLERNRLRGDMKFIAEASKPNAPSTYFVNGEPLEQMTAIHLRAVSALKRENVK